MWSNISSFNDVLKQATALKENLERQLDAAVGAENEDSQDQKIDKNDLETQDDPWATSESLDLRDDTIDDNINSSEEAIATNQSVDDLNSDTINNDIHIKESNETPFPEPNLLSSPLDSVPEEDTLTSDKIEENYEITHHHDNVETENVDITEETPSSSSSLVEPPSAHLGDELVVTIEEPTVQKAIVPEISPSQIIEDPVLENTTGLVDSMGDESESQQQIASLRNEIHILKDTLAQRERQLESGFQGSQELQQEIVELQEEVRVLKTKSAGATSKEVKSYQAKIRTLETKLREETEKGTGLFEEGVSLSKQLGSAEAAHKATRGELRTVTQERDTLITERDGLKDEVAKLKAEMKKLSSESRDTQEGLQQKIDSMSAASKSVNSLQEKISSTSKELETMRTQLIDSQALISAHESTIQKLTEDLSHATQIQENLGHQLSQQVNTSNQKTDKSLMLEKTINDLRRSLNTQRSEFGELEAQLRKEVRMLKKQVQVADARCEDLVASSAKVTTPLMRQIETLESLNRSLQESSENQYSEIATKMLAAEAGQAKATEACKIAETRASEAQFQLAEVQARLEVCEQEKARLEGKLSDATQQLQHVQRQVKQLEASLNDNKKETERISQDARSMEMQLRQQIAEVEQQMDRRLLEVQGEHEKDVKRYQARIGELENSLSKEANSTVFTKRMSSSEGGNIGAIKSQTEILNSMGFSDSEIQSPMPANSPIFQTQVESNATRLSGQIAVLQNQLDTVERTRDALGEELSRVSERCRVLEVDSAKLQALEADFAEKAFQYDLLLELVGEKEEKIEDLMSDIDDMKVAFRQQLDAFTK